MFKLLMTTQVIISVLLSFIIIVQSKDEGLSATFTSGGVQTTRRGAEKIVYRITIILAALFILNALLFVFV